MLETTEELLSQIRVGEDSALELKDLRFKGNKVVDPNSTSMATEIAAMANTIGGVVVLGVDDKSHEIMGVPRVNLEVAEEWIRGICADQIQPSVECPIRKLIVPENGGERIIIRVDVPKSLFVHKTSAGYYMRIGSSKREMSPDKLARLFQQRSQVRMVYFDEQPVPETSYDTLSPSLWNKFKSELTLDDERGFLGKIKILTIDSDGAEVASVSGVLMASMKPELFLPNARIQAVCYRGTKRDSAYQIDAQEITGPLDEQIDKACAFVARNMKTAATKAPGRQDMPQYSERAVFEAVTNAVAHRDYSIYQACIRLHMFADRLELFSPGAIPNTMTLDSMPLRQFPRNGLLSSLLARCPLEIARKCGRQYIMDRRGEGVPIIIEETRKLSGKSPVFKLIDGEELMLTLPAAS